MDWQIHHRDELSREDYERCLALMEPERRRAVLSVTHQQTRHMTVLGEWVVKCELAKRVGCPVEEVVLRRTPRGKPEAEGLGIHFSLSHTGPWLAAAFDTRPVGIDAELLRPVTEKLARRICTAGDWDYLLGSSPFDRLDEGQRERFFRIWTAKEAFYKREGTGITGLKELDYAAIPARHVCRDSLLITLVGTQE